MVNVVEKVVELSGASGFDTNNGDFDLLREAVLATGLDGALADADAELTVFAPTDEAFVTLAQTLGYSGSDEAGALGYIIDALTLLGNGDPIPLLTEILTYHVLPTEAFLTDVVALGDGTEVTTLQGGAVTIDLDAPGLGDLDPGLPDPSIILTDVDVDNGVIHVLDGVLLPLPVSQILSEPGRDLKIGDDSHNTFVVGAGSDLVDGNGGNDQIFAGRGADVVFGGSGRDNLFGGRGSDLLNGEGGRDNIFGGLGNDTIDGGAGNDIMFGGGGRDTFVFTNGSDKDRIVNFRDGKDMIDLSGYEGISSFDDLDITGSVFSTRIDLGEGDSIRLIGLDPAELDASDFVFADEMMG